MHVACVPHEGRLRRCRALQARRAVRRGWQRRARRPELSLESAGARVGWWAFLPPFSPEVNSVSPPTVLHGPEQVTPSPLVAFHCGAYAAIRAPQVRLTLLTIRGTEGLSRRLALKLTRSTQAEPGSHAQDTDKRHRARAHALHWLATRSFFAIETAFASLSDAPACLHSDIPSIDDTQRPETQLFMHTAKAHSRPHGR